MLYSARQSSLSALQSRGGALAVGKGLAAMLEGRQTRVQLAFPACKKPQELLASSAAEHQRRWLCAPTQASPHPGSMLRCADGPGKALTFFSDIEKAVSALDT